MITRSPRYWKAFAAAGRLRATDTRTGKMVFRVGRGAFLMQTAYNMIEAGCWADVEIRGLSTEAWIPYAAVPFTPVQRRPRRTTA